MRFRLLLKVKAPADTGRFEEELRRAGVMLAADDSSWIIQARSKEEAAEWARRAPVGRGEIEVHEL